MIKNKYDRIINQFEQHYAYLYEQVVDWWPSGSTCITVKLSDGLLFEFESFDNTIRRIQPENYSQDVSILRKDIGRNIKKIIQTRGIAQSDIATRCGITEAMLSRYIHGTSMPGVDKIHTLASILDCRVVDIIGESYHEQGGV